MRIPPKPSTSWIIHFQGGGWCASLQDCANRAKTELGSSKTWPSDELPGNDGGAHGFLNTNNSINPRFYDWNMVRFEYCDGASFSGYAEHPVVVDDKLIYFRGETIVRESFKELMSKGLDQATEIIITGCSAGGLAVYLHLDWIRSQFPSHVRIAGVSDSGFFMDLPDWNGQPAYSPLYHTVFAMQNVSFVNEDCLQANSNATYLCFFAQYTLPHIKTPLFIINPLVDSWQMSNILRLPCLDSSNLTNCSAQELAAVANFRNQMINNFGSVLTPQSQNGLFAFSCVTHCGACFDERWDYASIHGFVMRDAVSTWYDHSPGKSKLVDDPWPANTCAYTAAAVKLLDFAVKMT